MARLALLVVLLVSVLVARGSACFHSLRRPPYETYWLGTYHDSRFISLSCFALRSFRWTLKFIKVTYEGWHVEMEYAKCVSDAYGMNIPFITPPWGKNAQLQKNESDVSPLDVESRQVFPVLPEGLTFADRIDELNNGKLKVSYSLQRWDDKTNMKEIVTTLQPVVIGNNKLSDIGFLTKNERESVKEVMRVASSLYNILLSIFSEFEDIFSKTLGLGIFSCTKKYVKNAFWRWVDSAPFLK